MIGYKNAKIVRFSCAYLFRIYINGKYFLVLDEQGRNTYQPVGGVYKYTDADILEKAHATQCMRFGTNSDLDCDLRLIVPRNKVSTFKRWYQSEKGRESQKNLYREFHEEIIDRMTRSTPRCLPGSNTAVAGHTLSTPVWVKTICKSALLIL